MVVRDQLTPELLKKVSRLSAEGYSRHRLAKYLCETLDWRGPSGQLQLFQARKLLRELEKKQQVQLQPLSRTFPKPKVVPLYQRSPVQAKKVSEVGPIELILVPPGRSPEGALWNSILAHHPLGSGPLCGAQIRYLIKSSQGWLGGLAFSAAARHVRVRDQWIGWSPRARVHHRHKVLNNSRFLILPNVKVLSLASHVLSLASGRLPQDWSARYGYEPELLETYVDDQEHRGHCYRTANWRVSGANDGARAPGRPTQPTAPSQERVGL